MGKETIKITSNHNVIFSEDANSDTADVKFIICDFDPNANDVALNRDTVEDWLSTLNVKPVVGKIVTRFDGKRDFSGHNAKIVSDVDEEGNEIKIIEFDTSAFGSFYEVAIETIDDVEYIVAKAKIWKRFREAYKIIKNRAESKKGLKTSWEINVSESHQEKINGKDIKVIDQGIFIGHALLGEYVSPAYKSSGILEVASFVDDELTNALSQDMLILSSNENEENPVSNEGGEEMPKQNEKELSAMTDNDLYTAVRRAINNFSDEWYYISQLYPYEYRAIAYNWDRKSDEDYVEFIYQVNSDETVSITSQKNVKLRFVPVDEIESEVSELQTKLSDAEKEIVEAGKALTDLQKQKEELETQISELTPFKEKVEEMQLAEQERELSEKKEELKTFALEDELITSEELESDEALSTIFSELTLENFEASQNKLEVIKGKRAIAKFKETKNLNSETQVETSSVKETNAKSTLTSEEDGTLTSMDIVKSWVSKK
ncbi:hypothetical protein [Robertmurraya siralis]|uniref:hypothetical protein n=1 Tax=Robertmurraya siralis TaxID=77777 RepID=UPI0010F6C831|nr:hypothetical protein [Robertmurraya siralis]